MAEGAIVFHTYKYIPKNPVLTLNGETYTYTKDGAITYVNILHDYTARKLPVIQCGIEMEVSLIEKLYKYQDTAQLKLDIYEQEADGDGNIVGTTLYLQHTFSIIPARDQTVYITSTDSTTRAAMDVMKTLQNFEMYLIDMDSVNWFTVERDAVFEEATYAAALQAMFLLRDIPPKTVIATPPQQEGKVAHMNIPMEDLVHNIHHLNTAYGLYDTTPIVYYDLEHLYCISKREPNIVLESATDFGTVSFILMNPDKAASQITGSCNDPQTGTHWINLNSKPNIYDSRPKDTSAKLSTLTTVNAKGGVKKTTLDENATTLRYIYAMNDLSEAQFINETMTGPTVALMASNTSVKFLKPYKDYTFTPDTSYANLGLSNHIFRLLKWTLGIHREGVTDYISEVSMTLYTPEREGES